MSLLHWARMEQVGWEASCFLCAIPTAHT